MLCDALAHLCFEFRAALGVACQHIARGQLGTGGGIDQQERALPAGEAGRQQHDGPVITLHAPLRPQRCHARLVHTIRIKRFKVEAARNGVDLRHRRAVRHHDAVSGVAGIGDHRVAARHDRIVEHLPARLEMHLAVIGGNEMHLLAAGGGKRAPGRRAAACMDDGDVAGPDDAADLADILKHHHRVLGGCVHVEDRNARPQQLAFKPPAIGGDEGAPAARGDRTGHLDAGAFRPARVKLRDYLKHAWRCKLLRHV